MARCLALSRKKEPAPVGATSSRMGDHPRYLVGNSCHAHTQADLTNPVTSVQ